MSAIASPELVRDPVWLAHRLTEDAAHVRMLRADRAARHRAAFATDQYLPAGLPDGWVERRAAAAVAEPGAPLALILHSAFCCSTLLANLLDVQGAASVVKEPVLLNDLTGLRARGVQPRELSAATADALALLARPFEAGEAVVLKPSNLVNPLAPTLMALRPEAHVVLLFAPLEVFLTSVASKGVEGRMWVRELAWKLKPWGTIDFGLTPEQEFRLTDLQVAAIGWLGQHRLFHELARRFPARVAAIDSEQFLARAPEALAAIVRHLRLNLSADAAAGLASGPEFLRNAKTGEAFDVAARTAVHAGPAQANADEIAKVAAWTRAVAANSSVPMELGPSLLA
ncbi:MAG: hypothetical protein RQ833_02130 [Sphingomonadaceae bacterium]|nr:hypothetical protein [Sphingomonadaceae bacterium]